MAPEQHDSNAPAEDSIWQVLAANRSTAALALVALAAILAAVVLGILLLVSRVSETRVSPTPFPSSQVVPVDEALITGMDGSSTISVTVDIPVSLSLSGQDFPIQTQVIPAEGNWSPAFAETNTALWIYGSVINYVVGLSDSNSNRTLLEGLSTGDEILLTTRSGKSVTFTFNSRQLVPANNRDIFAQNRPGVTLVLLGSEGSERLVVNGRFVAGETTSSDAASVVELGEVAQLDNMQVTVVGATYIPDRPEVPPGFAFYLIDFQLQNTGVAAIETSRLQFSLADQLGNQYAFNAVASQLGNSPPLSGFLNSGQMVQATAGYQIPLGLVSPNLSWRISHSESGGQLQVIIPFTGGANASQASSVALQNVTLSDDRTSLVLRGQVVNISNQPLVVTEADVSLTTSDGVFYLLLATNPPFPWTVAPSQATQFAVTFQRPATADRAVFTVLNQPFELSNLR